MEKKNRIAQNTVGEHVYMWISVWITICYTHCLLNNDR